jgi:hypothetical protein
MLVAVAIAYISSTFRHQTHVGSNPLSGCPTLAKDSLPCNAISFGAKQKAGETAAVACFLSGCHPKEGNLVTDIRLRIFFRMAAGSSRDVNLYDLAARGSCAEDRDVDLAIRTEGHPQSEPPGLLQRFR